MQHFMPIPPQPQWYLDMPEANTYTVIQPFAAHLDWPPAMLRSNMKYIQSPSAFKATLRRPTTTAKVTIRSSFTPKRFHPVICRLKSTPSLALPPPSWTREPHQTPSPFFRPIQEDEDTTQPPHIPETPLPSTLPCNKSRLTVTFIEPLPFDPNNGVDKFLSLRSTLRSLIQHLQACDSSSTLLQCFPKACKDPKHTAPVIGPTTPIQDLPSSPEQLQAYFLALDPSTDGCVTQCQLHLAHSLPLAQLLQRITALHEQGTLLCSLTKVWDQPQWRFLSQPRYTRTNQSIPTSAIAPTPAPIKAASPMATLQNSHSEETSSSPTILDLQALLTATAQTLAWNDSRTLSSPQQLLLLFSVAQLTVVPHQPSSHSANQPHPGLRWLLAMLDLLWTTSWDLGPSCTLWWIVWA